jgi:hypothetical protein
MINEEARASLFFLSLLASLVTVVAERQERDSLELERGEFGLGTLFMRQNLEATDSKKNSILTSEILSFPTETQMNNLLEICKS